MSFLHSGFIKKNESSSSSSLSANGSDILSLEAGEDITAGSPLYILDNKFYLADNVINFRVVAIAVASVPSGFLCRGITAGTMDLSLSVGNIYYLGDEVIQSSVPSSGYVVRIGQAIKSDSFLVNIEEPILLS